MEFHYLIPEELFVWIDNANHTWRNVMNGISIPAVSGTITMQGLPTGIYTAEWWNTFNGTITGFGAGTVGGDNLLSCSISNLETDKAVKFSNAGLNPPTVSFETSLSSGEEHIPLVNIWVTLSTISDKTVAVDYMVSGGTAVNGEDYYLADGTLWFEPGETRKNIQIVIFHNSNQDTNETIEIILKNPCNTLIGTPWRHEFTIYEVTGISKWNSYN